MLYGLAKYITALNIIIFKSDVRKRHIKTKITKTILKSSNM